MEPCIYYITLHFDATDAADAFSFALFGHFLHFMLLFVSRQLAMATGVNHSSTLRAGRDRPSPPPARLLLAHSASRRLQPPAEPSAPPVGAAVP